MSTKTPKKYAILDLETTGGNVKNHRITEVAIRIHDGEKVIDSFESLVNPQRIIPPFVARLTGISDEMVQNVPIFSEVIDKIDELTKDCIVVAHNVNFDYGFLRREFLMHNRKFSRKKLCTVRLSRKLLPGLPSYSLGKLAKYFGHPISKRHRAGGDVDFTVELFEKLLQEDKDGAIEFALNQRNRESLLPPNLKRKDFDKLPTSLGIYFFKDQKGKVLYIGKAKNIKDRVSAHFGLNTNTNSKHLFVKRIYSVGYEECENEMIALLKEAHAIKKHWPPFNRSLKGVTLNYGLYNYEDQAGYQRLAIGKVGKKQHPLISFRYQYQARNFLADLVKNYSICPKLLSLQSSNGGCDEYFDADRCFGTCSKEEKPESFNTRLKEALKEVDQIKHTYCIVEPTNDPELASIVLIEKGKYLGYGFKPNNEKVSSLEKAKRFINYGYDDQDMRGIIERYLRSKKKKAKVIELSG